MKVATTAHSGRAARLRQTLGGRSGGPLVRSTVALVAAKENAHSTRMFARRPHVDGAIIVETHALLRCLSSHRAA